MRSCNTNALCRRALTFRAALQVILQAMPEGDRPGKVVSRKVLDGVQKRRTQPAPDEAGVPPQCAGERCPCAPDEALECSLWCDFVRAALTRGAGAPPVEEADVSVAPGGGPCPEGETVRMLDPSAPQPSVPLLYWAVYSARKTLMCSLTKCRANCCVARGLTTWCVPLGAASQCPSAVDRGVLPARTARGRISNAESCPGRSARGAGCTLNGSHSDNLISVRDGEWRSPPPPARIQANSLTLRRR